jgi:type IV pilus assembly protein PilM
MNPLAVYNAMAFDGKIKGTTMIVDLGAENTDLIIADEDTIWMRSIPIGGNNFTEALVKSFKLNFQKAEELKRNAASSKYARQIFQAMRPIFADLVAEVQRSIGFYASVHRDSRIKKIIALGGTFKLPGLQKYLQQNLQLEVERLDSLAAGAPTDPKLAATFNDNILSMVSAYGLAIQAMGDGKVNSNLLPARIRRERMWQEKTKWFGAAAALFVLGTGLGYGSWFVHNMAYQAQADVRQDIARVQGTASTLDSEWSAIETAGAADRERIKNIRSLTDYRDLWPRILVDINGAVPQVQGDVEAIKKTPRNERQQITLDSIETRYLPDLAPILADPNFTRFSNLSQIPQTAGGAAAGAAPSMDMGMGMDMMGLTPEEMMSFGMAAPTPAPTAATPAVPSDTGRGFLVVIKGVTPYTAGGGAGAFISDTLVKSLQAIKNDKNLGDRNFYVSKVELVTANPLSSNQQRLTNLKQVWEAAYKAKTTGQVTPGAGGGFMGGMDMGMMGMDMGAMTPEEMGMGMDMGMMGMPMPGVPVAPGAPVQPGDEYAFKDRKTGEDIRQDWEFTVLAAIIIDPPPPPADVPAEGADPAAAPADAAAAATP